MSSLIPFTFDSKQIRVTDQNGDPWFVLRDLLEAMGSKTKSTDAVESINQGLGEGFAIDVPLQTAGGTQKVIVVAESAATYLLSRSNTEKGRELNRFIHAEVLPSLRKTGSYQVDPPKQKRKRASSQLSGKMLIARQVRSVLRMSDTGYIGMVAKIAESEGIEPAFLPAYVDETLTKAMTGATVVVADRWFPSSKTCSQCGQHHPEIVLGVDTLRCECGLIIDRDLNAAINLANYAASSAVSACGEDGSGVALAA